MFFLDYADSVRWQHFTRITFKKPARWPMVLSANLRSRTTVG